MTPGGEIRMHDIKAIRDQPAAFAAGLRRRGVERAQDVTDHLLSQDKALRELLGRLQNAQARRNEASKLIGQAKAKKDEPRTASQLFRCQICEKLAKAHGADPSSNAPPKFPFLENGVGQAKPPSVNQPGDSGVTGKGKKGESIDLKVTAPAGTKLNFMCLIHPWMQAEVDVT